MRTKLPSPRGTWSLALIFLCTLILPNCTQQSEIKSPDQVLIEKLNNRFKHKNFISSHTLANPYDYVGKDVENFRSYLAKQISGKQVKGRNDRKSKNSRGSIFQFASERKTTLGTKNAEEIEFVQAKVEEYNKKTGKEYDQNDSILLNNKLNDYSDDDTWVNQMFEDGVENKTISETQSTILKSTLLQISKAKDLDEAKSINATVEFEVLNLGISENEKALILTVNGLFAQNFDSQQKNLSLNTDQASHFKKANIVAIVVLYFIVKVAVTAIVAGVVWTGICCAALDECDWDCVGPRVRNSVLTTVARGAYGLIFL